MTGCIGRKVNKSFWINSFKQQRFFSNLSSRLRSSSRSRSNFDPFILFFAFISTSSRVLLFNFNCHCFASFTQLFHLISLTLLLSIQFSLAQQLYVYTIFCAPWQFAVFKLPSLFLFHLCMNACVHVNAICNYVPRF